MKRSIVVILMVICSCRTVKEKTEQLDYQRQDSYTTWQRQQSQSFQVSDSTGRYWRFRSDSAFYYHPDSGLRASAGTLALWENSLLKQTWSSTVDSNRTEVLAQEKLNTWSHYYRSIKDSKWAVVVWILLVFGIAVIVYRYMRI